jgi:hypothetical protein
MPAEVDRARYDLPAEVEYTPGQWGFKSVAAAGEGYRVDI